MTAQKFAISSITYYWQSAGLTGEMNPLFSKRDEPQLTTFLDVHKSAIAYLDTLSLLHDYFALNRD